MGYDCMNKMKVIMKILLSFEVFKVMGSDKSLKPL